MATAEVTHEKQVEPTTAFAQNGSPVRVEPDLAFINRLRQSGGDSYKKCFQCGTCSSTCELSPATSPFPRKEMAQAVWGMRDVLVRDTDIWLCYQCNDCSLRCPRGARPGDILSGIRQECIRHFSVPRFLGRWANEPAAIPLLLFIPAFVLAVALQYKDALGQVLGFNRGLEDNIVYSYSSAFPHWLLNIFFLGMTALVLLALGVGISRFWSALKADAANTPEIKSFWVSFGSVLRGTVVHDTFDECTRAKYRLLTHMSVFFGFAALTVVTLWIITNGINPFISRPFVYPFGFFSPWKILANLGGTAVLVGILVMAWDRLRDTERSGPGGYFDWALIGIILFVIGSGFATEALHYFRLEPHRHIVYFIHLVLVSALILYLPYSKLAHIVYRFVALIHAEQIGRKREAIHTAPTEGGTHA